MSCLPSHVHCFVIRPYGVRGPFMDCASCLPPAFKRTVLKSFFICVFYCTILCKWRRFACKVLLTMTLSDFSSDPRSCCTSLVRQHRPSCLPLQRALHLRPPLRHGRLSISRLYHPFEDHCS